MKNQMYKSKASAGNRLRYAVPYRFHNKATGTNLTDRSIILKQLLLVQKRNSLIFAASTRFFGRVARQSSAKASTAVRIR